MTLKVIEGKNPMSERFFLNFQNNKIDSKIIEVEHVISSPSGYLFFLFVLFALVSSYVWWLT